MDDKIYTLTEKLRDVVAQCSSQIAAQIKKDNQYLTYTYQEFYNYVQKIGYFLLENGIKNEDKIAIVLENRLEWGCIYFGILLSGAIAVPLDTQSSTEDLLFFFKDADCKMVFTSEQLNAKIPSLTNQLPKLKNIIVLDYEEKTTTEKIIPFAKILEFKPNLSSSLPYITPDSIASILYTSGTTGTYKGVMLTHKNFYANFDSITKLDFPVIGHNILAILPLHHSFPFMVNLLISLFGKNKITYLSSLKSSDLLSCLQETKITVLVGVPQLLHMLHKPIAEKIEHLPFYTKTPILLLREILWQLRKHTGINLSKLLFAKIHKIFGKSLKYLVSGGAKLDDDVALFFLKLGFNILEGYGLTETSPIVTINFDKINKLKSAGKNIFAVDIKIDNPDQQGNGEILIRGANVMLGYYNHPDATKEALKNGWFCSGDLGYLDKDGYLYITGRKKEIIVLSSGKKFAPEELEKHYSNNRFIKEICVLLTGNPPLEKLTAVVVPNLEYFKSLGKIDIHGTIKSELELLSTQLPTYKRLMGFIIIKEALPKTRLGKIRRYLVQQQYAAADFTTGNVVTAALPSQQEINETDLKILALPKTRQILMILQNTSANKKLINLNDHLEIDLGIESLERVELINALEKSLKIKIPQQDISKIATVRELIEEINSSPTKDQDKKESMPLSTWHEILSADLTQDIKDKISLSTSHFEKITIAIIDKILNILLKIFWKLKVYGTANLPQNEPIILCSNHASFLDGFVLAAAIPKQLKKDTFIIGLQEFFTSAIMRRLTKTIHVITIDPGIQLVSAMQASAYVLHHNKTICIFPEGARSSDGTINEFKKGVGILGQEIKVRLVPVLINGTFEAWPRGKRFPCPHPISVTFGKPYNVE